MGEFGERRGDPHNGRSVESEFLVAAAKDELRRHFRPESFNRIDDIVLFKPLTPPEIEKVVDLLVADLRRRLADRRLTLHLTEAARRHIAAEGFDPVYGARHCADRWLRRGRAPGG